MAARMRCRAVIAIFSFSMRFRSSAQSRSHYVELHIKKPKANGSAAKLTIMERLDVGRVLIAWNGRYFLAYAVADEKDAVGVNFRARDNGITFNFRGDDWQSIKRLFRRAWQAPQVLRLWDALALEYGEL